MAQLKDLFKGYGQSEDTLTMYQSKYTNSYLSNSRPFTVEPLVLKPELIQEYSKEPLQVRIKRVNNPNNYRIFKSQLDKFSEANNLDEQTKKDLEYLAGLESSYNQTALNKHTKAAGYFQFLDSTRKAYSNVSKEQFLNDPDEQFKTAVKYVKYLKNQLIKPSVWKKGKETLSDFQILYGAWWRPKSIINYINTGKDTYINKGDNITIETILKYAK